MSQNRSWPYSNTNIGYGPNVQLSVFSLQYNFSLKISSALGLEFSIYIFVLRSTSVCPFERTSLRYGPNIFLMFPMFKKRKNFFLCTNFAF